MCVKDMEFPARGRQSGGSSLTEVLVAVALVLVLLVSLFGAMTSGFSMTQSSRENLRATQIMLQYVEGVRLFNWNQLVYSNWIPQTFTNYYYPNAQAGESKGIPYYGTVNIAINPTLSPPASYASNMASITVTVNWTNGSAGRTRTMTTYVARDGMQNYVFNSTNN